ncbi:hypothetical protein KC316_g7553 [Hortaea werneckii]|nr:hypothetical protein KC316_g7553 [Hortaea werneckii]
MHIAILGCGFMGTALIEGLLRNSNSPREDEMTFTACVRSQASADRLRQKFAQSPGVVQVVQGELAKAAARADIVMLGCQPQELTDLLHNHDHVGEGGGGLVDAMKHKLVISLLAGVPCQQLLDALLDASASATAQSTDQPRPFDIARVNPYVLLLLHPQSSQGVHLVDSIVDLRCYILRLTSSSQDYGSKYWVFLNASRRAPDAICPPGSTTAGS